MGVFLFRIFFKVVDIFLYCSVLPFPHFGIRRAKIGNNDSTDIDFRDGYGRVSINFVPLQTP